MLTKTNIFSVQHYLRGNTDRRQFENDEMSTLSPAGKSSADPHE